MASSSPAHASLPMKNPQTKNVGNVGDIIKHAFLLNAAVSLSSSLAQNTRIAYMDSHTFLLKYERSEAEWQAWESTMASLKEKHAAGYEAYYNIEKQHRETSSQQYLCSSGLALSSLRERMLSPSTYDDVFLILSEANPETRAKLLTQLQAEGQEIAYHACVASHSSSVVEAARSLVSSDVAQPISGETQTALLALVDPFVLTEEEWNAAVSSFNQVRAALNAQSGPALMEVFTYNASEEPMKWPAAPEGLIGPIVSIEDGPFKLCSYATKDLESKTIELGAVLGWKVHSS